MININNYIIEKLRINKNYKQKQISMKEFIDELSYIAKQSIKEIREFTFRRYDIEIRKDSLFINFKSDSINHKYLSELSNKIKQKVNDEISGSERFNIICILRTQLGKNSGITINITELNEEDK